VRSPRESFSIAVKRWKWSAGILAADFVKYRELDNKP
jgi:hypothetical protein